MSSFLQRLCCCCFPTQNNNPGGYQILSQDADTFYTRTQPQEPYALPSLLAKYKITNHIQIDFAHPNTYQATLNQSFTGSFEIAETQVIVKHIQSEKEYISFQNEERILNICREFTLPIFQDIDQQSQKGIVVYPFEGFSLSLQNPTHRASFESLFTIQKIARDILKTLSLLHKKGIVHGSINPHHILDNEQKGHYQLIGFGKSFKKTNMKEKIETLKRNSISNPAYHDPQFLLFEPSKLDPEASDLWALAATIYKIYTDREVLSFNADEVPSQEQVNMGIKNSLTRLSPPKDASSSLYEHFKDFLERIFHFPPKERLKLKEALKHPFIKNR